MIISFVSSKGGSGKTSTAASSAKALSNLGLKVLLIDLDAATNGLTLLFLENVRKMLDSKAPDDKRKLKGILEIQYSPEISPRLEDNNVSIITLEENLHFIPSTYNYKETRPEIIHGSFLDMVNSIAKSYDVTIIDAQAGTENLSKVAVELADRVVIVTEYDPMSAAGVERMKYLFSDVMPQENTNILVNKILPEYAKNYRTFFSVFKHLSPIPFDFDAIKSYTQRKLAIDMLDPNPFTLSVVRMLSDLLPEYNQIINKWKGEILSNLKKPLKEKSDEIKMRVDEIQKNIAEQQYRPEYARIKSSKNASMLVSLGVMGLVMVIFVLSTSHFSIIQALSSFDIITIMGGVISITVGIAIAVRIRTQEKVLNEKVVSSVVTNELQSELKRLLDEQAKINSMLESDSVKFFEGSEND